MPACFRLILPALFLAVFISQASAQQPEAKTNWSEVVQQLGDTSYKTRESATKRLMAGGAEALAALHQANKDYDLEVRLRVQQILAECDRRDLNRKLAALLADETGEKDHDLPAWKRFKKTLGAGPAERELYVEMVRSEFALMETLEKRPAESYGQFSQRMQMLQFQIYNNPFGLPVQVSSISMAALLFVGMEPDLAKNPNHLNSQYMIVNLFNDQRVKSAVMEGAHWTVTRRMLEGWILANSNEHVALQGLMLAMNLEMNHTARGVARKMLENKSMQVHNQSHAILAIGRLGGPDDFALVSPFLTNKTVCNQWQDDQKKKPIQVEVRDIALVVLLRLTNQQPKDYGFGMLQENPQFLYHMHTIGFREPAEREAAQKKFQDWLKKRDEK